MTQVLWEFADATRTLLLWKPLASPETVSQAEVDRLLYTEHWIMVSEQLEPDLFLILSGQLLRIRSLSYDDYPLTNPIARERDVAQGHAVPVALAFPVPEQISTRLDPNSAVPLTATHLFPPPTFGQIGVVFSEGQRWSYPLHLLDAEASQLQAELAATLQRLVSQDFFRDNPLYQHAQVLAFRLACRYRDYHQACDPLPDTEHKPGGGLQPSIPPLVTYPSAPFSARPSTGKLSIPPLFQSGQLVLIPSPLPTRAVFAATSAAQHCPAKWEENAEGIPTFTYREAEGTAVVEVRPKELASVVDERLKAALWEIVQRLSPFEAALFLALLGFCLASPPDETGNHWIPVERILEARDIQHNMKDGWGAGYRWKGMVRVAEGIDRLNALWLQIEQVLLALNQPGAAPAQVQWSHYSKLLHIEGVVLKKRMAGVTTSTKYLAEDLTLFSGRGLPVAWHLHFGTWLRPFLQGPNRQVAQMGQRSLSYQVGNEQLEFLLLQHLTFLRVRKGGLNPLHLKVGSLFDELSLPVNMRHPQKTMDRFHQALCRLHTDKQIFQVQLHYDPTTFPSHHWLETWFNCSLTIFFPPA